MIIRKVTKSNIEETIRKMTNAANELFSYGLKNSSRKLFLLIDDICEKAEVPISNEAVSLNIALDEHFGYDVLSERRL